MEIALLKIGMKGRLWTTVAVVVGLITVAQIWAAMNFAYLEEKLIALGVTFSPTELQIVEDNRALPWFIIITSMLVSAAVVYLFVNYLIRPVKVLARGVRAFAAGNFDHRITLETGDEIEELAEIFNDMAQKIQRKQKALEEAAIRDQLTGLFNRRHLMEAIELEIARCERQGGRFALAIMDVDHFKTYNDREGHLAGDEALRQTARVLTGSCRRIDTLARYGGEEFVAVLPGADRERGRDACARLRRAVELHDFTGGEQQPLGRVTLSIGVASYPEDGKDERTLLAAADRRLYRAKEAGRNYVTYSDEKDAVVREEPREALPVEEELEVAE